MNQKSWSKIRSLSCPSVTEVQFPQKWPLLLYDQHLRGEKTQNINYFYPPIFVQWCLPSAAPCIGKDFFPSSRHFYKNPTAHLLVLPHLSDVQPPTVALLFLSPLASSLQTSCSVVLTPLKVKELLQKWHLSFRLTVLYWKFWCLENW